MNEKRLSYSAHQEGTAVVTRDHTYTKAKLVEFQHQKYAVNPNAILTINCTSKCNAQCFFCYNSFTFMRADAYCCDQAPELDRAIQFATSAGISVASLSGGEPTICPEKLIRLVKKLKSANIPTVRLHTNGFLLGQSFDIDGQHKPLWRALEDCGLDEISVSVADYRQERNSSIMQIDTLSALRETLPHLANSSIKVRLSCYLCPQGIFTPSDVLDYAAFAAALGIHNLIFRKEPSSRRQDLDYLETIESTLLAAGWRVDYHHEKTDSIIVILFRGVDQIMLSCVNEEVDPDAKIRRLIYMPDRVLYTSWIDPASYLFPEDAGKIVASLEHPPATPGCYPGKVWSPRIPDYIHQDCGQTIDLHVHSLVSDGHKTPSQVLEAAASAGIRKLVFTEHNCLHDSPDELAAAAQRFGIQIPMLGVEFSTVYCPNGIPKMKFHLLVYGNRREQFAFMEHLFHPNEPRNRHLRQQYQQALERNLLSESWEKLFEIRDKYTSTRKKMFVRTPIANAIAEHCGITPEEAKEQYLPRMPDVDRYRQYLDTVEIISLAHRHGCVAVLAHPGWIRSYSVEQHLSETDLWLAVTDLARQGLDGIEISHRLNNPQMREKLLYFSVGLGLIPTGGSDYHGKPRCVFGVNGATEENLARLLEWIK